MTVDMPRTKQTSPSIWFCFQLLLWHCKTSTLSTQRLFSQRFFGRPLLLPPCTVPCKIVLASPDDLDTCPNHFNLHFFTVLYKALNYQMSKLASWIVVILIVKHKSVCFNVFSKKKNNPCPAQMYSLLWNRPIWQNSLDSQWLRLGWTSPTYPGCTARGFFLMHAAGC